MILTHPLITSRFFPPRPASLPDPFFVDVAGARLACWRSPAPPGAPTVLHFHANRETVAETRRGIGEALVGLGVGVVLAEQRGVGASTGQQTFAEIFDDAEAILAASGVPAERVVAFGRSLGSAAAIDLAARHRLAGLILESGLADVAERIRAHVAPDELGVSAAALDAEVRARFDHEAKLARHRGPILVLHSGADERVPRARAADLASWAGGDDKELVVFRRGDHADVFEPNRDAYLTAVRGFLARV